ncbi:uncharacterized protein LOC129331475 [Eublepharis macularius]|uniref:Uncharacterized protein LOC129331475 n=1 Tax=Eublepharis macularius TaxID=481883 RepID=A0AA97JIT3_EUBMA|nr:uncharacterized protein LOC129331475 [Eublepharis macularius]
MAKGTYQASLQFLVGSFVVQAVVLQTDLPLKNVNMPSTVIPQEARNTTISSSPGIPTVPSKEAGNKTTLQNADTSIAAIRNATSFTSMLHPFAQTTHSSHIEASSPAEITAEITTDITDFPTESFISNSPHQSPGEDSEVTTSAITQKLTSQPFATSSLSSSTVLHSVSASQLPGAGIRMKNSEFILTVGFALILTLTILGLVVYILNKYRIRRAQYSHHQLYDSSVDTVDRYATPDDTLVISGGLYDASYNSNTTMYEDEALQTDHLSFSAQPGQFRLEFFGEKENGISLTAETLKVPPGSL